MIGYRRENGESNKTAGGKAKGPCKSYFVTYN